MSDQHVINFAEFTGYKAYDGDGAAALLPFDGYVQAKVKNFRTTTSSGDKPKPMVRITLLVDESDLQPSIIYGQAFTGGVDRNDDFLSRQFGNVLVSSGLYTEESLKAAAARGDVKTVDEMMNLIMQKDLPLFVEIQADTHKGKTTSKVTNFVTRALYEKEKAADTHRRARVGGGAAGNGSSGGSATKQAAQDLLKGVLTQPSA